MAAAVTRAGAVPSGSQTVTDLQVLIKRYKLHFIKFKFGNNLYSGIEPQNIYSYFGNEDLEQTNRLYSIELFH